MKTFDANRLLECVQSVQPQGPREHTVLPAELRGVNIDVLEDYVKYRLIQFAGLFAKCLDPNCTPESVQHAAARAIRHMPQVSSNRLSLENRDLQLVFRHDCLSLGCLDPQCSLCEHNPNRRCNVNFAPKYLVNDILRAKCEAPIRVEVIDRASGMPVGDDVTEVQLEMCILDGNAYDAKCLEAGHEREEDLDACSLFCNNKSQPLLQPNGAAGHSPDHRVIVQLAKGLAQLPDLHVTDSSEAMLSGRKPPFRLLVRAISNDGARLTIRHAVSEGFVVATRRTRTAGKVEIPNVDDHVSKLEHMGKETVKKLQNIQEAAIQAGVEIPETNCNSILKVGEFRKLALLAEGDGHMRQRLQQILKLSKEKWDEARDHAMRAVVADNRMRTWYAEQANPGQGLLFTCRLGNVDLDKPVGLLHKKSQDGPQTTMEVTLMAQQTHAQREQGRLLLPKAVGSWWQAAHPGWAIYPVDSEEFSSTGALNVTATMPNEPFSAPHFSPHQDAGPMDPQGKRTMPRRHSGSKVSPSGNAPEAMLDNSPFANDGKQDPTLMALAPFLKSNGSRGSAGLPNVHSLQNFPSLSQGPGSGGLEQLFQSIPSGDLQQLMAGSTFGTNVEASPLRLANSDMRMPPLNSMEIPDAAAAVALFHNLPQGGNMSAPGNAQRANSGLEAMQSLDQALGNVEQQDVMDRAAEEFLSAYQRGAPAQSSPQPGS